MRMRMGCGIVALAGAILGCAEPPPRCDATYLDGVYEGYDRLCTSAAVYAARESEGLVPTAEEIALYYERLQRAAEAEPLTARVMPMGRRSEVLGTGGLRTSNPAVFAAWSGHEGPAPWTGDPAFDAILAELVAPRVYYTSSWSTSSNASFAVGFGSVVNEEKLHERLLATGSELGEPVRSSFDASWHWLGAGELGTERREELTAQLDLRVGWGDCFSGCSWYHDLRAIVPPTGEAVVYDLGGDPLPATMQLRPTTLPPP